MFGGGGVSGSQCCAGGATFVRSNALLSASNTAPFRVLCIRSGLSCVGPDGAANDRPAHRALLQAGVAALTHGEVAARHQYHRTRRAHTHDAHAVAAFWALVSRAARVGAARLRPGARFGSRAGVRLDAVFVVQALTPNLLGARHEVGIAFDPLLALPLFVRPKALEQLLGRAVIISCE